VAKKQKGVNPELEKAIGQMLAQVMSDPTATLIDKCRVMDRAINVEKLKLKISDDEWGAGFLSPDDDSDE
jgi:hypothetical protein